MINSTIRLIACIFSALALLGPSLSLAQKAAPTPTQFYMRIAVLPSVQFQSQVSADVMRARDRAIDALRTLGAEIEEVRVPVDFEDVMTRSGRIIAAEAYALHRDYIENPELEFDPWVKRRMLPLKPVTGTANGALRTAGDGSALSIAPANAARYTPYVRALEAVDSRKLAATYAQFYPLFQQSYAEQGYPNRYFNDRVFEVIDHLLATPDIKGPIALAQPKVLYEYADPALEELSAGQKAMLRMLPKLLRASIRCAGGA